MQLPSLMSPSFHHAVSLLAMLRDYIYTVAGGEVAFLSFTPQFIGPGVSRKVKAALGLFELHLRG